MLLKSIETTFLMHSRSGKTPEPTSLVKRSVTGFVIVVVISLTVLSGPALLLL